MSVKFGCKCDERKKSAEERRWEVLAYRCNHEASSGYRFTASDYSTVRCLACGASGRTQADYVDVLYRRDNADVGLNADVDLTVVLSLARHWRDTSSDSQPGGVVMIFNGEVQGWAEKLRTPGDWAPGYIAVDADGGCWEAVLKAEPPELLQWIPVRIPSTIPSEPKERSDVTFSDGSWRATHGGTYVSFSVSKFGPRAKVLAQEAHQRLVRGQPVTEEPLDDTIGRYQYPFEVAARELNMTVVRLRQWLLTGIIDGLNVRPPVKVAKKDCIAGFELYAAVDRLKAAREVSIEEEEHQ